MKTWVFYAPEVLADIPENVLQLWPKAQVTQRSCVACTDQTKTYLTKVSVSIAWQKYSEKPAAPGGFCSYVPCLSCAYKQAVPLLYCYLFNCWQPGLLEINI